MSASARESALAIWRAGVDAVKADSLIAASVKLTPTNLSICDVSYKLDEIGQICVVGAGKAAGYLAQRLEQSLLPIADTKHLHGWVNVPDNCLVETRNIRLHPGRPAGVNEPREEGVHGARQILKQVSRLGPGDLCICLLTGGGSALLPAPRAGVTLADKLKVTRLMSANGASIQELNRVRTAMSEIKGGGLRRACTAEWLTTLIVSDVIGDPLDVIASGPTVDLASHRETPIEILRRFANESDLSKQLWEFLANSDRTTELDPANEASALTVRHHILANNQSAVAAAAARATALGFHVSTIPAEPPDESAEGVARELVRRISTLDTAPPTCLVWGGEPVVKLVSAEERGTGGRNQQLVLTALSNWHTLTPGIQDHLCILSAGTDGEDGPTDAAGAFCDQAIVAAAASKGLAAVDYLHRNDAYTFFDAIDGLIRTGPTHTNVCDLRVAVVL